MFGVGRESSERVEGWQPFQFEKLWTFFVQGRKNMKQLAFFMNPYGLSWTIIS